MTNHVRRALGAGLILGVAGATPAMADVTMIFDDGSGLSAWATFSLIDSMTMEIRMKNTSTGAPAGFSEFDQILSAVSWDFGNAGPWVFDPQIADGNVKTGLNAHSMNFSEQSVGGNEDVSREYGFSNSNGTGLLQNFVSAAPAVSGITQFLGTNLHGPDELWNEEGGLVSDTPPIPVTTAGAIQGEIVISLNLDRETTDLSWLETNGARVEFGNDAWFVNGVIGEVVPAPGALALLAMAGLAGRRRRR